ncbi:heterokaryon incompatibility protein-domain-containing protein, partial [Diaporthe sp. PMI_573]
MAWAKSRIDECTAGHPKCGASYTGFLPTRLIFVPLDAKTNGVSLRHRDSVPRHARYAALSHCWGPKESWPECQTTAHNYEQQLLGIPWTRIPQTFTDAIIITRQLGLEYIWIDSLCIIQQDESDWKVESVAMHQVYSNAHITLAAVDSHDSHGGLWLGPSLHWEMPDLLMTFIWKGRRYPLLLFSEPVHPTWGVVHGARFEPWDRPPLLTRAWAFQERVVSPRTLFFGKGSLVWDCFTESEVQPDRLAELLRVASIPCYGPKQHFADYSAASASPTSFRLWYQIVSQYTRLRLSVATDKLPGIAAIAQSIHASRPEDKYICGLWQSSFVHDLLW